MFVSQQHQNRPTGREFNFDRFVKLYRVSTSDTLPYSTLLYLTLTINLKNAKTLEATSPICTNDTDLQ